MLIAVREQVHVGRGETPSPGSDEVVTPDVVMSGSATASEGGAMMDHVGDSPDSKEAVPVGRIVFYLRNPDRYFFSCAVS